MIKEILEMFDFVRTTKCAILNRFFFCILNVLQEMTIEFICALTFMFVKLISQFVQI